jgi:hypothetical protein
VVVIFIANEENSTFVGIGIDQVGWLDFAVPTLPSPAHNLVYANALDAYD